MGEASGALQCFPLFANPHRRTSVARRSAVRSDNGAATTTVAVGFKALAALSDGQNRRNGEERAEVRSLSRLPELPDRAAGGITCSHSG